MKPVTLALAVSAVAFTSLASADTTSTDVVTAKQAGNILPIPKVGIRVGGGNWNEFMVNGGVDVTFNVPVLPLPQLRVDAEIWGKPSNFGKDRRGNALSLLEVQSFAMGYAGLGPTYYFTDDQGDHKSGIGLKVLGGMNLSGGTYVEAGLIFGPKNPPLFFTVGRRF
jgi:hypothetical protein